MAGRWRAAPLRNAVRASGARVDSPVVDPFVAIMTGIVVVIVITIIGLGLFYPGSGAAQVGWRTPREHADEEARRDDEDLRQMLEAANERRRARGERELTVDGLIEEEIAREREWRGS